MTIGASSAKKSPGGLPGLEGNVCDDLNHAPSENGSLAG